jgi:hypothetical protein
MHINWGNNNFFLKVINRKIKLNSDCCKVNAARGEVGLTLYHLVYFLSNLCFLNCIFMYFILKSEQASTIQERGGRFQKTFGFHQ